MKFKPKQIKIGEMTDEQRHQVVLQITYTKLLTAKGMGRMCPKCNEKNPLDNNYCVLCGTHLGHDENINKFREEMSEKTPEEIAKLFISL